MRKVLFGIMVITFSAVANAGHHENEFPFEYFLHNDM